MIKGIFTSYNSEEFKTLLKTCLTEIVGKELNQITSQDNKANKFLPARKQQRFKKVFTLDGINFQYRHGVAEQSLIAPENTFIDDQLMKRPGNVIIQ